MLGNALRTTLALISLGFAAAVHAADDPTMHQVYVAAQAGQFAQAQRMMDKVLQDHPNSAKAHFVEAELLAKQGRIANAAEELNKAEALEPGLPFAKPESVQRLQQLVTGTHSPVVDYVAPSHASAGAGISWIGLLLGGGMIAFLIFGVRSLLSGRSTPTYAPAGNVGYGASPAGQMPSAGGSIGSGIMGGLATGAAVGAGMVAGEALAHHFLDGDGHRRDTSFQPPVDNNYPADDDMGGADFGIGDSSSWDDNLGGGDDGSW